VKISFQIRSTDIGWKAQIEGAVRSHVQVCLRGGQDPAKTARRSWSSGSTLANADLEELTHHEIERSSKGQTDLVIL
jgi:hypothetical protein